MTLLDRTSTVRYREGIDESVQGQVGIGAAGSVDYPINGGENVLCVCEIV